ncbi:MAG: hypothetical protein AAF990_04830 [Bacteroidota bacterium]
MKQFLTILMTLIGLSAIAILGAFQFGEPTAKEMAIIQEAVEEKVAAYVALKKRRCREKIMKRAEEMADSILLAQAKDSLVLRLLSRPDIPLKPMQPDILFPEPSTDIAPLIDPDTFLLDSLRADSLMMLSDSLKRDSLRLDSLPPNILPQY